MTGSWGDIIEGIFKDNRPVYGARKIKVKLASGGQTVSRTRITRIMKNRGLISAYTRKKHHYRKAIANEANVPNLLQRDFSNRKPLEALVSDVTYTRVAGKWAYTCLFLDLANRELVGHAASWNRDAGLAKATFASMDRNLFDVDIFHTDRGSEYDNMEIDKLLEFFHIRRSLSNKGTPLDNAVAEATFKLYKAEFAYRENFNTLEELQVKLSNYVHWFNNVRIHGTLGYMTPVEFREKGLSILSS